MGKVIAFICLLSVHWALAQDGRLVWSENQKLSWEDFTKLNERRSQFVAESSCGLYYRMTQEGNEMRVFVESYFVPDESWVVAGSETDDLLSHEQLHFDIAELWARKMRKSFARYEMSVTKFIEAKADKSMAKEYEQIFNDMMQMQQRYDDETAHGTIEKAQAEWEKDIRKNLDSLREYAGETR